MSLTKKGRDMWDSPQQRYRKFHSYPGLFPNNWRKIFIFRNLYSWYRIDLNSRCLIRIAVQRHR